MFYASGLHQERLLHPPSVLTSRHHRYNVRQQVFICLVPHPLLLQTDGVSRHPAESSLTQHCADVTVVVQQLHRSSSDSFSFTLETEFLQEMFKDVNLCSVKLWKVFFIIVNGNKLMEINQP